MTDNLDDGNLNNLINNQSESLSDEITPRHSPLVTFAEKIRDLLGVWLGLRPFNFQAIDSNRKKHSVQYISLPKFDWSFLRDTYPNKYEHALLNSVDPNSWFHVKIIINKNKIQAFINSDVQACLSVIPLTHNQSGKLGFWVGNNSDGDFSNLIITTN